MKLQLLSMKRIVSPSKQQQYIAKFKYIDNHIIRSESLQNYSHSQYQQVLKIVNMKLTNEPSQQIYPFTPKTFMFSNTDPRTFFIQQQTAPPNKRFILNINAPTFVRISLKVDQFRPKIYAFQGNKGIQIQNLSFKQVLIQASIQKINLFSSIKFNLDLIQIDHPNYRTITVNRRPNIDLELKQYLEKYRGKTAEIIRSRSLSKLRDNTGRRTAESFKPMSSIDTVRSKSQYQKFQKQKSLYIKHVRKMSPEKVKLIQKNEVKYLTSKKNHLQKISVMIVIGNLGQSIRRQMIEFHRKKLRKMKITWLCQDFIKIIKNKFRLKITDKARYRMNMFHSLQFLPSFIRKTAVKRSKESVFNALTPYMDFRTIQELGANSEEFIYAVKKIKAYFTAKLKENRVRIRIIIETIGKRHKIELSQKQIQKLIQTYLKHCKSQKSRWTNQFFIHADELFAMMKLEVK